MSIWTSLRETFVSAVRQGRLWLLQFFGNALLFLIFVWFLHVGEAHWYQVGFDFLLAALVVVGALWLHAGTLNYFVEMTEENRGLRLPFATALRHLPAVLVWAAIFVLLRWLIAGLDDYHYKLPGYLGSVMPAWMRRPFGQEGLYDTYDLFVSFLRWIVLPGLLLPLGLLCADRGFRGFMVFGTWLRMIRNLSWWIVLIIASLVGVYCTGKLMEWTLDPKTATLAREQWWLGFRLLIAYLLAILSWLWVCAMVSRARLNADAKVKEVAA